MKHGCSSIILWVKADRSGWGIWMGIQENNWSSKVIKDQRSETGRDSPLRTKHTVLQWMDTDQVRVLKWFSLSPDLKPNQYSWRKILSKLTELELFYKDEWAKILMFSCEKLEAMYPTRLGAVTVGEKMVLQSTGSAKFIKLMHVMIFLTKKFQKPESLHQSYDYSLLYQDESLMKLQ